MKNGLEEDLQQLERKLKTRLVEIGSRVGIGGGIQGRLTESLDAIRKVLDSIEKVGKGNRDISAQVQDIQVTTQNLLSKLNVLK
jgi:hypothetical protein